jgi:DNA end-binding protein Ku
MAPSIWKGSVSFGLVSIPVKLYSATEEKGVSFRQVHESDGGRIKYKRVCSVDGEEIPFADIGKGYELPDGDLLVLTDDDFSSLPLPTRHTIEVLQFVPAEQIDGLYLSKGYYLSPEGAGTRPYVLLREALERSGRVGLVKVALRNRETLATLRTKDGVLLVQTMLWPDEIREAAKYAPAEDVEVRDQEVAMAQSFIETLSDDFDPMAFSDDYRAALEELVQAKSAGRRVEEPAAATAGSGNVLDLMAALRASVDAAKQKRADGEGAPAAGAKKPAKSAAGAAVAGKAPAKASKSAKAPKSAAEPVEASPLRTSRKKAAPAAKATPAKSAGKKSESPDKKSATARKSA